MAQVIYFVHGINNTCTLMWKEIYTYTYVSVYV